ncbi:uncharacterized protein ACIB01_009111 [Guaruba guarouba]
MWKRRLTFCASICCFGTLHTSAIPPVFRLISDYCWKYGIKGMFPACYRDGEMNRKFLWKTCRASGKLLIKWMDFLPLPPPEVCNCLLNITFKLKYAFLAHCAKYFHTALDERNPLPEPHNTMQEMSTW